MKPALLVLAAGMGSRYGGVKQIDSVGQSGECLLDFAVFDAMKSGFGKVIFVIRRDIEKDFRERLFDRVAKNFDADYVFQSHDSLLTAEEREKSSARVKPWGTLHAILCAENKIESPFAVINSDDYYGREAFSVLGKYLSSIQSDSKEHAMVGYVLGSTMSESGSVSRGICSVENGFLKSIEEHTKISYKDGGILSEGEGNKIRLTGNEWVSMNLFGFSVKAFDIFNEYWIDFKKNSLSDLKKEALLPVAASDIVKKGEGSIRFFTSSEKWFGMTYPEDREIVKKEILKKIDSGYYPNPLWDNR